MNQTAIQLSTIFGPDWEDRHANYMAIPESCEGETRKFTQPYSEIEDVLKVFNDQGYGIFFCPNEFKFDRLKIDDNRRSWKTNTIAVDIDIKNNPDYELPNHLIKPTLTIKTPGGWHLYWKLQDWWELDSQMYKDVAKELIKYYDADWNCSNINRVFRVAGYYHNKSEPQLVEVIDQGDECDLSRLYAKYLHYNRKLQIEDTYFLNQLEKIQEAQDNVRIKRTKNLDVNLRCEVNHSLVTKELNRVKKLVKYKSKPKELNTKYEKSKRKYSYFQQFHHNEQQLIIPISLYQMFAKLTLDSDYGNLNTFRIYLDMHFVLNETGNGKFVLNDHTIEMLKARYEMTDSQLSVHLKKITNNYIQGTNGSKTVYFKSIYKIYQELSELTHSSEDIESLNCHESIKQDSCIHIPYSAIESCKRFKHCFAIQLLRQLNGYDLDECNEMLSSSRQPKLYCLETVAKILNISYTTLAKWIREMKCSRLLLKKRVPLTDDGSDSRDLTFEEAKWLAEGKLDGYWELVRSKFDGNWYLERPLGTIFKPLHKKERSTRKKVKRWFNRVKNFPRNWSLGALNSSRNKTQYNQSSKVLTTQVFNLVNSLNSLVQKTLKFEVEHSSY